MKAIFFFFSFFCLPLLFLNAQIQDDFSDGNFSENPTWLGQTEKFEVVNEQLQLNDPAPSSSNTSYLYIPAATSLEEITTWEFFVQLDFSPSSSNFAMIYLMASQTDLSSEQFGYFLRIGGISGNDDAIELFRQDGNAVSKLISGSVGAVGTSTVTTSVRVTRSPSGTWELWVDYSGGTNYQSEGTAEDITYASARYFGFVCQYTRTRANSFAFDNVFIDPLFVDRTPPVLLDASAISSTEISLQFDEPLDPNTLNDPDQYSIDQGIGMPLSASINSLDNSKIDLVLNTPLTSLTTYNISADRIGDPGGNIASSQQLSFTFFDIQPANPNDVIFTEIMADPNPTLGLPEEEYIELYNRSDKIIQLADLSLSNGGTPRSFPEFLLLPQSYVIITDDEVELAFAAFGEVAAMASFPSLTNAGSVLRIVNQDDITITELIYSIDWYGDPEKDGGGYSLELIQLEGPYDCGGNWLASNNSLGGTPGTPNSVANLPTSTNPPILLKAIPVSNTEVVLFFDKALDPISAQDVSNFQIDQNITINEAILLEPRRNQIRLNLVSNLQEETIYSVTINTNLKDCIGNQNTIEESLRFGIPQQIEVGDIVINEILFLPEVNGKDFVELFNSSDKVLNLADLRISNAQKPPTQAVKQIETDYLLLPSDYAVITTDPNDILQRYTVPNPKALIQNPLPTFDAAAGNVSIGTRNITIDSFDYSDDLHFALLRNRRGVSLERTNPQAITQSPGSWHSAAATVGFATPTGLNSQFIASSGTIQSMIDIPKKTFSPDEDGFDDIFQINYELATPGYTINIEIYDATGRLIRKLVNNTLLASSGSFKWDGTTNEGIKARLGIYILWIELFSPDGSVERQKEPFVVAGNL